MNTFEEIPKMSNSSMTKNRLGVVIAFATILTAVAGIVVFEGIKRRPPRPTASQMPTEAQMDQLLKSPSPDLTASASLTQRIDARIISSADTNFQFTATMPALWQAAAVPEIDAINLFNPHVAGENDLEKSQIFIRFFRANAFLTLSTVTIHERTEFTLSGRPAVRYDIEKKPTAAGFPSQPSWRNVRHIVTDIRVTDTNPSVFYVIARRPNLDQAVYEAFLTSLTVTAAAPVGFIEPTGEFRERITKKPYGIFITPESSPIQPERFHGYHTAVDVEYGDVAGDVPVFAIADGEVVQATTAAGYGGLLVVRQHLPHGPRIVIYGHVDPASLPAVRSRVTAGQQIAILGDGGTRETDGERKHLHFGIRADETVNLRGYVASEAELADWIDPLSLF